jgi:hypothetical protein
LKKHNLNNKEPLNLRKAKIVLPDSELLLLLHKDFNRVNAESVAAYFKKRNKKIPSLNYLKKHFKCTEFELFKLAGIELGRKWHTDKELLSILKKAYKETGHTPAITEIRKYGPSATIYKEHFGSWGRAIKSAGLSARTKAEVKETNAELLKLYRKFSVEIGKAVQGASSTDLDSEADIYNSDVFTSRFGSMKELRIKAGFNPGQSYGKKYSKEEITRLLITVYKRKGRIPSNSELKKIISTPSLSTIQRYFKTTKMSDVWKEIRIHR